MNIPRRDGPGMTKHRLLWLACLLFGLLSLLLGGGGTQAQDKPVTNTQTDRVLLLTIDDEMISPITAEYIEQGIATAQEQHAEALVIQLDTPGGLLSSTHAIVKSILNSPVPVVVYVSPAGARAGSAGVFITLSAHIAAMAPSTRIGAAHPVDAGGNWPPGEPGKNAPTPGESGSPQGVMSQKILNDTITSMRVIARTRGRNEQWAVRAVTESVSITAEDALKQDVIDTVAPDLPSLLAKINRHTVTVREKAVTLSLAAPQIVPYKFTVRQQILSVLTNPMLAYMLLMIGFYGILFEVTHPGINFAGLLGFICLILALIGLQAMSINMAGLGLMALGVILFIVEFFTPSFGVFLGAGVLALVMGTLLLYQTGEPFLLNVIPYIAGVSVLVALLTGWVLKKVLRTHHHKAQSATDKLIGQIGKVTQAIQPGERGKVRVYGEIWTAEAEESLQTGEEIRVTGFAPENPRVLMVSRVIETEITQEGES